jgi:ribosomal protein S18 acetylase RimI-like enzyme
MKVIKVDASDVGIIKDILTNHIDSSDRKSTQPSSEHLKTLLNDDRSYLFAAMQEHIVVGYALVYRFPSLYSSAHLAYLYDIEVSVSHRRKGIGRLLIKDILEHLKQDNVNKLWLGTGVDNPEGQGLFGSTGAIKFEEVFNDYTYYLGNDGE